MSRSQHGLALRGVGVAAWLICVLFFVFSCEPLAAQPPADEDPATGVTIQLPILGVSIDAAGVLTTQAFVDPNGSLMSARRQAVIRAPNNRDIQKQSQLRKVSLKRLEAAVAELRSDMRAPTEEMLALAGLQRLQFVFVLPDEDDIVIAGPAEGWVTDLAGRRVGLKSGLPTLLLEDLLAALRTFGPTQNPQTWVGCSIDPTPEGIEELNRFKRQIPARISMDERVFVEQQVAAGLQESLGLARIQVYGVPRKTHLAQILVEADYRMKLIAIGREPPPIKMTTFIDALRDAPRNMQRWWLTPNYQCVKESADHLNIELVGRGVKLSTENITFGQGAQVQKTKLRPSKAAVRYADSFSSNYEALAQASPVFGQLRNVIDMLVAAAWIRKNGNFQMSGWVPNEFLDENTVPIESQPDPKTAPAAANAVWKGNILIAPVGGGVSIHATDALSAENLLPNDDHEVDDAKDILQLPKDDRWWWD